MNVTTDELTVTSATHRQQDPQVTIVAHKNGDFANLRKLKRVVSIGNVPKCGRWRPTTPGWMQATQQQITSFA